MFEYTTTHHDKNYPAQKVNSAESEKRLTMITETQLDYQMANTQTS